jgi:hypothetical protein
MIAGIASHSGFRSSELAFTDPSPAGLSIVPASCPSGPGSDCICNANTGECGSSCRIVASPATINKGEQVNVAWNSKNGLPPANYQLTVNPAQGSTQTIGVGGHAGNRTFTPDSSTRYTFSASWKVRHCVPDGSQGSEICYNIPMSVSCSDTVTVHDGSGDDCTDRGDCDCDKTKGDCDDGHKKPTVTLVANPDQIPVGDSSTLIWSSTLADRCDGSGFITGGSRGGAVPTGPLYRNTPYSVTCINQWGSATANATVRVTVDQCVPDQPYCVGDTLHYQDFQCNNYTRDCAYGCSSGQCNADNGDGQIETNPFLVRPKETTTVHWHATGVKECTVHGTNGDGPWSCTKAGCDDRSHTSSPIEDTVIYTMKCTSNNGKTFDRTARVGILPEFIEK